jgi:hypothetical protein
MNISFCKTTPLCKNVVPKMRCGSISPLSTTALNGLMLQPLDIQE